ncbi:MAG: hypothetical protein SVY53_00765 [Chloroflexota bacterium]|nr:hypothetical protein [Chloroflexota bacterium]
MLKDRLPAAWESACQALGKEALHDLERRLTLYAIDEGWSEHLATITEIRDSVHLAEVAGLSPLEEFQKGAAQSFIDTLDTMDARMVERFMSLKIISGGVDMEELGLRGPASTWTYVINDHAFDDPLAATLTSRHNIGFAANAALTGPLLMFWALTRTFTACRKRRGSRPTECCKRLQ